MNVTSEIPVGMKPRELLVLVWTEHFFGPDYLLDRKVPLGDGGQIRLRFTTDRNALNEVDAVWFHAPSMRDLPPRKNRPWVLMSMESDANYPHLRNQAFCRQFDILMTYRLDSDVPCIYPNWHQYGDFLTAPTARPEAGMSPSTLFVASNPVPHRDSLVAELMKHLQVDSLGRCLKNADIEDFVVGGWAQGAWSSLLTLLPRYKFYLAFENSLTTDYVTERVFHALVAGTVPVYRGAANIRDFMPDDNAVIDVADFDSPEDLARYLKQLDRDLVAYGQRLKWKHNGYSPAFKRLVDLGSIDPMQRLAIKLAHGCNNSCNCGGRLRAPGLLP